MITSDDGVSGESAFLDPDVESIGERRERWGEGFKRKAKKTFQKEEAFYYGECFW